MPTPRILSVEAEGQTLIVVPLVNVSSLAQGDLEQQLKRLGERLGQSSGHNVVIDFGRISFFGTSMLEAMRTIWRGVRRSGGKMALCNLSDTQREVLRVAGFDRLWPICPSRQEALQAVAQ